MMIASQCCCVVFTDGLLQALWSQVEDVTADRHNKAQYVATGAALDGILALDVVTIFVGTIQVTTTM
ncbi:hypothetical protein E2C01_041293 [Portunus trituberculatus]|uniref:Uncharacterized protein n=1 Tax=Portunus trituberculatus TaxID=210409 RepID=A0A5B7FRB7_PORTR|nr:hypothetical protein [Portunus trituberculatus]